MSTYVCYFENSSVRFVVDAINNYASQHNVHPISVSISENLINGCCKAIVVFEYNRDQRT